MLLVQLSELLAVRCDLEPATSACKIDSIRTAKTRACLLTYRPTQKLTPFLSPTAY